MMLIWAQMTWYYLAIKRHFVSAHCKEYYYPGQKNRYSRDIHEVDSQCDHEGGVEGGVEKNLHQQPQKRLLVQIFFNTPWSCDIVRRRLRSASATRVRDAQTDRGSRRCRTEARYRTVSHDRTVDQPHEFLGCNDFFGGGRKCPA